MGRCLHLRSPEWYENGFVSPSAQQQQLEVQCPIQLGILLLVSTVVQFDVNLRLVCRSEAPKSVAQDRHRRRQPTQEFYLCLDSTGSANCLKLSIKKRFFGTIFINKIHEHATFFRSLQYVKVTRNLQQAVSSLSKLITEIDMSIRLMPLVQRKRKRHSKASSTQSSSFIIRLSTIQQEAL